MATGCGRALVNHLLRLSGTRESNGIRFLTTGRASTTAGGTDVEGRGGEGAPVQEEKKEGKEGRSTSLALSATTSSGFLSRPSPLVRTFASSAVIPPPQFGRSPPIRKRRKSRSERLSLDPLSMIRRWTVKSKSEPLVVYNEEEKTTMVLNSDEVTERMERLAAGQGTRDSADVALLDMMKSSRRSPPIRRLRRKSRSSRRFSSLFSQQTGPASGPSDQSTEVEFTGEFEAGEDDDGGIEEEDDEEEEEEEEEEEDAQMTLSPKEVVESLDRFIVGQEAAKKAVAIAIRNRWRRKKIGSPLCDEIVPKNILMIGPTGCGKTEVARRLAKLVDAPFVKVEATKFTEVGYHGRDVDQIIRDLVENAVSLCKAQARARHKKKIDKLVESRILEALVAQKTDVKTKNKFRKLLRSGDLEEHEIDITLNASDASSGDNKVQPNLTVVGSSNAMENRTGMGGLPEIIFKIQEMDGYRKWNNKQIRTTVAEARKLIDEHESEKIGNSEGLAAEAVRATESEGIVFIDEIDKIVSDRTESRSSDASDEGVQRDLLPIIEGSTVATKYGNINTDHILFIASGAFHHVKPSNMLAELQGRLPIRVELKGLGEQDLFRILREPESNLILQQQALLSTEGVTLNFTEDAVHSIAKAAASVNESVENIGARRLHTILERIVEEISFNAPEMFKEATAAGKEFAEVTIDADKVDSLVGDLVDKTDLSKFVL